MADANKQIKLLIVDDDVKLLSTMSERLGLKDFDVSTATDGKSAIKVAKKGQFDVAILDLKMPGMDGLELLEILKKKHKYLEIIMLTGFASVDTAMEAGKLGAFGYLEKPYNFENLVEKLKDAYVARLKKKLQDDDSRMDELQKLSMGDPLSVLAALKRLDDDVK